LANTNAFFLGLYGIRYGSLWGTFKLY